MENIKYRLSIVIMGIFSVVIHELAHGMVAYKLGDDTAKNMGRLTLNPVKHIDILGSIMLLTVGFGWAKPVPINPRNFKNPKYDMAITALAGPASNIILAFLSVILATIILVVTNYSAAGILWYFNLFSYLNVTLAIVNLLPIPPLDGSKIFFAVLPDEMYNTILNIGTMGMIFLLFGLKYIMPWIGSITGVVMDEMWSLMLVIVDLF